MRKLFLCQIPLNKPSKAYYEAMDNKNLQIEEAFAYPLLLLIRAYAKKEDQVKILLTYNNEEQDRERIEELRQEVRELRDKIGFDCNCDQETDFRCLKQDFQQSLKYQVRLFLNLLDETNEVDQIYADISFGNKPTPIVIAKLLEYIQKTREVTIGHVSYASILFHQPPDEQGFYKGYIYDVTPLFSLSRQIDLVARSKSKNPDNLLKTMIQL